MIYYPLFPCLLYVGAQIFYSVKPVSIGAFRSATLSLNSVYIQSQILNATNNTYPFCPCNKNCIFLFRQQYLYIVITFRLAHITLASTHSVLPSSLYIDRYHTRRIVGRCIAKFYKEIMIFMTHY